MAPDIVPVTLAGLVMDNEPDTYGVRWRVMREGLVGWAAPAVEVNRQPVTGRHGVARGPSWYRARQVTIRGRALAPSYATAWDAYYRLVSAVQLGDLEPLVVGEPVPKQLDVDLEDDPDITEPVGNDRDGWRFPFQVPLSAAYPFKRSTQAVTVPVGAGQTVSHTAGGERPAEIEVTVTSAGTVDLTIAGLRLRWGSLPVGAVLTSGPGFSRPKRTALSSTGANLFAGIVQPMQWPAMVPGTGPIKQAGTAGLDIRYFPTYP